MNQSVKERLKLFLKDGNIKGIDFCEKIGVSSGFISGMRESIQPDKIRKIVINYPALSIEWLLTGEGNMLKSETSEANIDYKEKYVELLEENRELLKENRELSKENRDLCRQLEFVKKGKVFEEA
jgi:transcriptional regulator with XRE-family HTH domain